MNTDTPVFSGSLFVTAGLNGLATADSALVSLQASLTSVQGRIAALRTERKAINAQIATHLVEADRLARAVRVLQPTPRKKAS